MTSFKLFAGTDVGLRDNNEDNFTVNPDLTLDKWIVPANQQNTIHLGNRGCLMVVADGMGGMNAGEVASNIAIKTVQQLFSPSKMPTEVVNKPDSIISYIRKVIIQADEQIKQHCKDDPSTEGMGSTIVMAWLFGDNVYVGWLGDSRAYSFIPGKGISRLSKDHSYVQELVDAKMLTETEAMIHPESNVIIRSLGDATQNAKPDIVCHPVTNGEIILLCSDGLCGVCEDTAIANIISQNADDLKKCKEALTNAALDADGSDNITIALLQIDGTDACRHTSKKSQRKSYSLLSWQNLLFQILSLIVILSLTFVGLKSCGYSLHKESPQDGFDNKDTVSVQRDISADNNPSKDFGLKERSDKKPETYLKRQGGNTHYGERRNKADSTASKEESDPEAELNESPADGDISPDKIITN